MRMAVARPPGPAPMTSTSYSIASRGPYRSRISCGVLVVLQLRLPGILRRSRAKTNARSIPDVAVTVACYRLRKRWNEEYMMSYCIDLAGRVALVTGASSGLGMQFAKTLAASGCGVV